MAEVAIRFDEILFLADDDPLAGIDVEFTLGLADQVREQGEMVPVEVFDAADFAFLGEGHGECRFEEVVPAGGDFCVVGQTDRVGESFECQFECLVDFGAAG